MESDISELLVFKYKHEPENKLKEENYTYP